MRFLADRPNSTFKYVFAKLDAKELPLFDQPDLCVGFEDSPEGPRGANLLGLLCGMRGVPLPEKAVVMAQQVDAAAGETMMKINGAILAGNAMRELLGIGMSDHPGLVTSPAPILAAAQGLIRLGEYDDARTVLKRALQLFAQSVRARLLEGMALRRLKKYQEALDVLSELEAAGHQDLETLENLAEARDGLYLETRNVWHLRKARELYRKAFTADPTNYRMGINAALKSLFLGEPAEAARLAGLVLPLVKDATDGKDLDIACALGEVYLLQGRVDDAAAQYEKVIDNHPDAAGDLKGTRQQAERICAAPKLSREDTAKVMAPFKLLDEPFGVRADGGPNAMRDWH